nr:LEAF RUST 10 DISEASE-RESISTANCE LOCUS RECEPTOR-LIKE PROTEIN KINASE-like 1.1 [Ipomoea batatas]
MALPFNPPCFFSFLVPLMTAFYFVHGEAELLSNCINDFSCGNLGFVEFPFVKHTQHHCGLVAVNCDTTPPTVQLGTGGDWYQLQNVLNFGAHYAIKLGDSKLQKPFGSHNYSNLNYTIHFQNSPSIAFFNWDASLLNTYFNCNDSHADDIVGNYESLTAQFVLRMEVSQTCQECYHGGGLCTEDSKNQFHCAQATGNITTGNTTTGNITTVIYTPAGNRSKRKPIPIIVSGTLALIVVSMAIFLVWQHKNGRKGRYSRNTSSDPTSDLERGRSRLFGILVFSYSELEEATRNFDPSKELGDGAFGTVYYGGARKAMRWTWGGPSLADGVILKHAAATKSSSLDM